SGRRAPCATRPRRSRQARHRGGLPARVPLVTGNQVTPARGGEAEIMPTMASTTAFGSYEEAVAAHRWEVPERYNIAADVCDRHPREKLAMIHEDFAGNVRRVSWGELQDNANRFANVLVAHGVEPGDRVAMLLPPTPETAAAFIGTWKTGAILLSMSVLYGDEGIRHRVGDSQPKVLLTNEANVDRIERSSVEHLLILDDELLSRGATAF